MIISVSKILLWLAAAFFIFDAITYLGLTHEPWLLPGGLAAWVLSVLTATWFGPAARGPQ